MRWSEAVTLEFVKTYLKHECLWNPSHPGYKLKYQRDKAYVAICTEFKASTMKTLSVPEVKIKIKNLRTTYIQQVHKILKKSSPDSIYEPSLIWFHEMDRCLKHIPTNRHFSSLSSQDVTDIDTYNQIWVGQDLQDNNDNKPDPLISNSDDDYEFHSTENTLNQIKKEKPLSHLSNKKIKKKKIKHRTNLNFSNDSNNEIKEDEFDIYGKYIASQLREMDLQKAIRLQLEIQSLVSEARILDIASD